jgi:hypothetical protein
MRTAFESYWDELERPKKQLSRVVGATSGEVRRTQSEIDIFDARMVLKSLGMILGVNIFVSGVLVGLAFLLQRLFVIFLISGLSVAIGRAQELSANPFGLESTANPFSEAGSPFGRESINNPFSEVGSPFSVRGVDNPFGTGVKLDTSDPLDRELGLDKDPLSRDGLIEAAAQKTKELVEESAKESAQWDLARAARMKELQKQAEDFERATLNPKKDKFP